MFNQCNFNTVAWPPYTYNIRYELIDWAGNTISTIYRERTSALRGELKSFSPVGKQSTNPFMVTVS